MILLLSTTIEAHVKEMPTDFAQDRRIDDRLRDVGRSQDEGFACDAETRSTHTYDHADGADQSCPSESAHNAIAVNQSLCRCRRANLHARLADQVD